MVAPLLLPVLIIVSVLVLELDLLDGGQLWGTLAPLYRGLVVTGSSLK
jgi:hypothetical protein